MPTLSHPLAPPSVHRPVKSRHDGMSLGRWWNHLVAQRRFHRRRRDAEYERLAAWQINEQLRRGFNRIGPPPGFGDD
ncbi:hypothetical protein AB0J80_12745 [Actinoplanes sp. NPDC049548]|uniref:hypothetical protein n=1 Tax=Actinoplanes sp. NPDC049548 TaxID=3155152 RepID=UPI00343CA39B